jgi:hypothetical protein
LVLHLRLVDIVGCENLNGIIDQNGKPKYILLKRHGHMQNEWSYYVGMLICGGTSMHHVKASIFDE